MDKQLAKEFRERWKAVASLEAEEQRAASLDLRWRQMNAILGLAMALKMPLIAPDRQEDIVRQRWVKLKSLAEAFARTESSPASVPSGERH